MKNRNPKSAIIVQARTGSTRLPRKMMLKLNGVTVIEFFLNRLKQVPLVDKVIIATTELKEDDLLVELIRKWKIEVYRGSSANVLQRYYDAIKKFNIDIIVRICGDNLFLETSEIVRLLQLQVETQCDYISNCLPDQTPLILTGTGLAVEIFTREAVEKVFEHKLDSYHTEHVTPFFYENTGLFSVISSPIPFHIMKGLRLTLDIPEDFLIIKEIYNELKPEIDLKKIFKYLEYKPGILQKMRELNGRQSKGRKG